MYPHEKDSILFHLATQAIGLKGSTYSFSRWVLNEMHNFHLQFSVIDHFCS